MAGELTSTATTQAQNQGYELAHANTHPIYELVEHVEGMDLQIQSYRISSTQSSNGISKRSPRQGPVLIVKQKPEALSQINSTLQ